MEYLSIQVGVELSLVVGKYDMLRLLILFLTVELSSRWLILCTGEDDPFWF